MPDRTDDAIYIADYDPRWPQMFEEERVRITGVLGEWVEDIQHCGSTAVPGLAAKPVIDVYVALRPDADVERCIEVMQAAGYRYRGKDLGFPGDHLFLKTTDAPERGQRRPDGTDRTHNIHMCVASNPEWQKHILFRDFLRQDASVAQHYGRLKRTLAEKCGDDIKGYGEAKTEFIEGAIERARGERPRDIYIYIADYDPRWPRMFEEERARIQDALGALIVAIEHVGSTSIPGIAAKPVIDIAVGVPDIRDAYKTIFPLSELGYRCMGEAGIPERLYFKKPWNSESLRSPGSIARTHQIHMYETTNPEWDRHIIFRDYLRAHPGARAEYELLKRELAQKHADDIEAYAMAKSDFVLDILTRARAEAAAKSPRRSESPAETSSPVAERGAEANR